MNTTMKTLSALALATATLSAASLLTSSIASANSGNVHGPEPIQVGNPTGNVHGPRPIQVGLPAGNVHGPQPIQVGNPAGNVHGSAPVTVIGPNRAPPATVTMPPQPQPQPGQVISCHPGSGCTLTPPQPASGNPSGTTPPGLVTCSLRFGCPQPPKQILCATGPGCSIPPPSGTTTPVTWGGQPPVDHDHDHDHDHDDRDHRHWSHWDRGLDFPVVDVTGYAPDSCIYAYKFRTIYVPGVGLERAVVKVCEAIEPISD